MEKIDYKNIDYTEDFGWSITDLVKEVDRVNEANIKEIEGVISKESVRLGDQIIALDLRIAALEKLDKPQLYKLEATPSPVIGVEEKERDVDILVKHHAIPIEMLKPLAEALKENESSGICAFALDRLEQAVKNVLQAAGMKT